MSCLYPCVRPIPKNLNSLELDESDLEERNNLLKDEAKKRSKQIEKELKKSGKIFAATIKLLLLGTGESGKSTVLKQMRIIHTETKFTVEERLEKIYDIRSNIRDSVLCILDAMDRLDIKFEDESLKDITEFVYENIHLLVIKKNYDKTTGKPFFSNRISLHNKTYDQINQDIEKIWNSISKLWNDNGFKKCAKRGNEYHLIDSYEYFLDRIGTIRSEKFIPSDQDMLRCRVLTTGILETKFIVNSVNFHVFDVGGQRDQRRKWIQCFNQVTAIIFVVDISSFNMTLREDSKVNRLRESLQAFRQIWINRYLYHISVILFLNKYDILVKKIVEEGCKLEDYFPEYEYYKAPLHIDKHLRVVDEHPEVTRAKMFILEQFVKITNEQLSEAMHRINDENLNNNFSNHNNNNNHHSAQKTNKCQEVDNENEKTNRIENSGYPMKSKSNNSTKENRYVRYTYPSESNTYEKKLRQLRNSYKEAEQESISGKFCIPYFTCAVDTDNIKRVFKACSHILKKEHLEKCGLL